MLDMIASKYKLSSLFWELASCFYDRDLNIEEIFCLPFSEVRNGSSIGRSSSPATHNTKIGLKQYSEISYTLKYREYKPKKNKWTIRQTGIYHRYDTVTCQSLFVLLSSTPSSKAHCEVEEMLHSQGLETNFEAFQLHRVPFTAYFAAWREYIAQEEGQFIPLSHCLFGDFIHEPLSVGYDSLSALTSLETRLLQIPTMLASATDTLDELCVLFETVLQTTESRKGIADMRNQRRRCVAYSKTASHLQQQVHMVSGLLTNTLLFRDQFVAKEQNKSLFQLNKSAVFLTTLGLLYLPSSFMATFFGMNFFIMDETKRTIVGTSMIWIYLVSSAALTVVTFLLYNWLLRRDNSTLNKLAPKEKPTLEWNNIKKIQKRLTFRNRKNDGLQESKA
ncbi:uncharacterized protein N7443_004697 [Penicillium atrosanguineum]|nr:uncharacterized protein N7443_004697 [Penicillium atrosanguineum]KAJ5133679.1 Mg2+ transporter protein CorA-like/Zinc transport protein ZntB [Penicillium atrosanguineum]KAJ5305037.1 hypothetical protein N7443_004697 [Penicillium atrosanguineum]